MRTKVVVEWTRASARIAVGEARGRTLRLRSVQQEPLGPTSDVAEVLQRMTRSLRLKRAEIIGVVPREHVLTRTVKFPSTQPAELASMVELYAKGQLPYPREQTIVDFHIVDQSEGFSLVAVVACQREVVERLLDVLRRSGLPAHRVTVSSWGLLGWWRQGTREPDLVEPCLIVHVDDARMDLVAVGEGRVLSARSLAQGVRDWGPGTDGAAVIAVEVDRSLAAMRKELPASEVRSVVLTGVGPLGQWQAALAGELGRSVRLREAGAPLGLMAMPGEVSPVVVGGLALTAPGDLLNLNPPEVREGLRHEQQVRDLALAGALVVGVVMLGGAAIGTEMTRARRVADSMGAVLRDVEPVAKQLKDRLRSVQAVEAVLLGRRHLAGILAGVFQATPAGVSLEAIGFERGRGEFTVRGQAGSTQQVLEYVSRLESLEGLSRVRLRYATQRSSPAGERTDFEILMESASS